MSRLRSKTGLISHLVLLGLGLIAGLAAARWLLADGRLAFGIGAEVTAAPSENRSSARKAPPPGESPQQMLERKLREWDLDPDQIRRELERAGRIIREKSREAGEFVREEWPDVKTMAVIKGRYILDEQLDAWDITVGCKDGRVTLSGEVDSADDISRAIVIALDTSDVLEVSSTLEVRPKSDAGKSS